MRVFSKGYRWILPTLVVFSSVLPAISNDQPTYEFDRKTVTEFNVSDELAKPLVHAFEASTGQAKDSMAPSLNGSFRASGNWAVFTGEVSTMPATEMNTVPLAVLFLKSRNGWLVVDFAGGQEFEQIRHWLATFDMPTGLIEKQPSPPAETKAEATVVLPSTMPETVSEPTPTPKHHPEASESSPKAKNKALAALETEYQLLQEEIVTLQNQLKDLPNLRDAISDEEFARNVKKFDEMGEKFSSLKDAYIESAEREREKHVLASNLRESVDTAKLRLDEISRQMQSAKTD